MTLSALRCRGLAALALVLACLALLVSRFDRSTEALLRCAGLLALLVILLQALFRCPHCGKAFSPLRALQALRQGEPLRCRGCHGAILTGPEDASPPASGAREVFLRHLRIFRWMETLFSAYLALQLCLMTAWKIPNLVFLIAYSSTNFILFRCPHCGERLSPARAAAAVRDGTLPCRYCENPILGEARPARNPSEPPPWV